MAAVWIACAVGIGGRAAARVPAGSDALFEPTLRWVEAAEPETPWIPRSVRFAADGEWVWAAPALATPQLLLLASAAGDESPLLFADAALSGALGSTLVYAPETDAGRLFALARYDAPGGAAGKRTVLAAYEPSSSALGAPFAPVWTVDAFPLTTGAALLAGNRAGTRLVVAVQAPGGAAIELQRIDPATGALLQVAGVAGGKLRALELAATGELLLLAGADLWVLAEDLTPLHHETLSAATSAVTLSDDGRRLAVGGLGTVRLLDRLQGGASMPAFAETAALAGESGELPILAAGSADGGTLAVAWWHSISGAAVRVEVWDTAPLVRRNEYEQTGAAGGLQNYPAALVVSPSGARIACGFWGYGDAQPEVVLLERGLAAPVFAADTGGSVRDLDLDPSGTRVAVALKHLHANQFGTTGEVRLYDTGERDLQVQGIARAGGALALAHFRPGALWTWFLLGSATDVPFPLPGCTGLLRLDPALPIFAFGAQPDASGRADVSLPLAPAPALVGLQPAFQAVSLVPAGASGSGEPPVDAWSWAFSAVLARPVIL